jgi:hypothetical protein
LNDVAGQEFVLVSCGTTRKSNSARVIVNRSSTGGLYSGGLEMISKGSRFSQTEGDYIAEVVDASRSYLKTNTSSPEHKPAVIRICCSVSNWTPSLQVVKLGCCDIGYHGVPFLAKAIRALPLTTLHLRENVCIGSNFGCLAGAAFWLYSY